jgi:hypothetical protein
MAETGSKLKENGAVKIGTLRKAAELQQIGNRAVQKAQEENRKLGIPNWYSINGVIISDQEISRRKDENK